MHLLALACCAAAVVQLEVNRATVGPGTVHKAVMKTPDNVVIGNAQYYYYANIGLGTPPQQLQVQIDTGSSDLWVMDSSNPFCRLRSTDPNYVNCSDHLVFNSGRSSTYSGLTTPFSIDYADTTFARGHMATDTLQLGGVRVPAVPFALANRASSGQIVMGIGYKANEALDRKYNNVPLLLQARGVVHTNAFSLWLNDMHATSGSLLFGAVDHSKYSGTLGLVPIVPSNGNGRPDAMNIMLHGISVGAANTAPHDLVQCSIPVLLDSGTSYNYLPTAVARAVANSLSMRMDRSSGMYEGAYPQNKGGFFEFDFSGIPIRVPLNLLVDPKDGDPSKFQLLLVASDDGTNILGDAFLRSCYVAYDLDHDQIGIAQANYNVATQRLEEITGRLPGRTAPQYSATAQKYVRTVRQRGPVDLIGAEPSRRHFKTVTMEASKTVEPYKAGVHYITTTPEPTTIPIATVIVTRTVTRPRAEMDTVLSTLRAARASVYDTILRKFAALL